MPKLRIGDWVERDGVFAPIQSYGVIDAGRARSRYIWRRTSRAEALRCGDARVIVRVGGELAPWPLAECRPVPPPLYPYTDDGPGDVHYYVRKRQGKQR